MKKHYHNGIRFLIISVFILLFKSGFSQSIISDTVFKYYPGLQEPPSGWKTGDFDDSGWETGYNSIGWGDEDDYTVIDKVPSCYLRYEIDIADTSLLHELVFLADFDDAFAAYINGVEIARVNLGKVKSATHYDQLADRSHEAEIYRTTPYAQRYLVLGYYIDDTVISKHMFNGKNILSIEVHNDSLSGSDLTLNCALYNSKGFYYLYEPLTRYKRSMELDSTILPIIKIESDEFGIPANDKYDHLEVLAKMGVIDNGTGKINKPDDFYNNYNGQIKIEVRGQSSYDFPKRSYNIELQDSAGNDTSVALMGLPRESDWVLQGPYADKSQIRNAMIYELGRKTGHWNPRTAFCEVIINGEFVGLYNLVEDIKRDSFRLDIANLNPDEISGNNLTGGYIFKYDKGADDIQIVYPKEKDLQDEQRSYINNLVDEYEGVLATNDGLDPVKGYKKYIDCNSLIDYMIVAELGKNCDSYLYSSFMHKDRDDRNNKIIYGPLWDFDLCFGNSSWQEGYKTDNWQFAYPDNKRFYIKRLLQDTSFVDLFETRWTELRESFLSDEALIAKIDSLTQWLADPIKRNYEVWPVIDKELFWPAYNIYTYEEEIDYVKNWILTRTSWIDANISNIYYPVTIYSSDIQQPFAVNIVDKVFPNPFTDQLNVALNLQSTGEITINLISVTGRVEQIIPSTYVTEGDYLFNWNAQKKYPAGLYILDIRLNNEMLEQVKVLKVDYLEENY